MKRGCFAATPLALLQSAVYRRFADRLLHNNRDGTSSESRARQHRQALPAALAPRRRRQRRGWVDVFVANDGDPNQL